MLLTNTALYFVATILFGSMASIRLAHGLESFIVILVSAFTGSLALCYSAWTRDKFLVVFIH
ncbi:transmembrane protein, putative [Medicago truncatula]|uniref:Transmembrane protein, putative n=1 Tax=Medicago truncatula TaxID=3880 RepID=G7K6Z1_MEDTR|nr:transmembrane protein, putative [Medicago truncatula]